MPAVVPSQIVQYIEKTFKADERIEGQPITLHTGPSGALNGLIHLVDQVPNVLLPSDPEMYAAMIRSIEEIRFAVKRAESQDYRAAALTGPPDLRPFAPGQPSPVEIIRRAFAKCPDEVATGESQELLFIKDSEIRSALLRDLATTRSALFNEEWKAATVIAGSIVEALLLWAIKQKEGPDVQRACSALVSKGVFGKSPPSEPLDWNLHQCIETAAEVGLVAPETAAQARLAKDFRNLIHPGRALKKQQDCDRGSALAAQSALELVARDLRVRFC